MSERDNYVVSSFDFAPIIDALASKSNDFRASVVKDGVQYSVIKKIQLQTGTWTKEMVITNITKGTNKNTIQLDDIYTFDLLDINNPKNIDLKLGDKLSIKYNDDYMVIGARRSTSLTIEGIIPLIYELVVSDPENTIVPIKIVPGKEKVANLRFDKNNSDTTHQILVFHTKDGKEYAVNESKLNDPNNLPIFLEMFPEDEKDNWIWTSPSSVNNVSHFFRKDSILAIERLPQSLYLERKNKKQKEAMFAQNKPQFKPKPNHNQKPNNKKSSEQKVKTNPKFQKNQKGNYTPPTNDKPFNKPKIISTPNKPLNNPVLPKTDDSSYPHAYRKRG